MNGLHFNELPKTVKQVQMEKIRFLDGIPREKEQLQVKDCWHQCYWREHDNDNVPSTQSLPIFCFDNPHQSDEITASACLHLALSGVHMRQLLPLSCRQQTRDVHNRIISAPCHLEIRHWA